MGIWELLPHPNKFRVSSESYLEENSTGCTSVPASHCGYCGLQAVLIPSPKAVSRFSVDVVYIVVSCSPLITTADEEQFDSSSDEGFTVGQRHAELCLEGTTEDKRSKSATRFWPTDEAETAGSTGSVAVPEAMEVVMVVMDVAVESILKMMRRRVVVIRS
ncbi:hypothetical protein RHMOL_Rhmol04G0073100 [Rhododendron molle]|uniref:Uncharacterized protein n=1 Tax=Rhododendron molle TaxID=49168 RepID=A0ACC0P0F4_RHOML|nr:hypothetical protein RHMOL_Rhmol04G0073100 [Rhododendron molle]